MFNLYFAGRGPSKVANYKMENNLNQLFSQLNERSSIKEYLAKVNDISKAKLFIDSGAWSAHSQGKEVDVDDYIKYLNENDPYFYIYAQVDKIPGEFRKPKTREQKLEAPEISWKNYLYMKDKVKSRDKLIPVFHQGEDFKWLENMLEYTHEDTGEHIPYIGISPANDSSIPGKLAFVDKCFDIIKHSSNPNVKTHAFGMTSLKILEKYPFTSADSTSYLMQAVNGSIMTEYGAINISDRRLTKDNALFLKDKSLLEKVVSKYGFTVDELATSIDNRMIYNIKYLLDWCKNYEYKPDKIKNTKLF